MVRSCPNQARFVQRDGGHSRASALALASTHRQTRLTKTDQGSTDMTKFYSLIAAAAVFMPVAMATLNQAAMIVS